MTTRRRWTKEEETILVQAIQANPLNIKEACRQASSKINRTMGACLYHWYYILTSADNNAGASFLTVGPKGIVKNRKNKGIIEKKRVSIWHRIKKFLNI